MPLIQYASIKIGPAGLARLDQANAIISEYTAAGYDLTLRQLYYQFVARALIPNNQKEYKNLGELIGKGRMAGIIDWDAITDRTRMLRKRNEWSSPIDILSASASQFRIDLWDNQINRPEVWVEKDALVGVFDRVCRDNGVAYFSCRGYTSLSELWTASQRIGGYIRDGQVPIIFHFGDHDPSGIDMTRDIRDRLTTFLVGDGLSPDFEVRRLALNREQIRQYNPPPNPAKLDDPRAARYIAEHGAQSWELDALDPRTLTTLVENSLSSIRQLPKWKVRLSEEKNHRANLKLIEKHYDVLIDHASSLE